MAHEMSIGDDGILRLAFIGDVGKEDMDAFLKDLAPSLETVTEAEPFHLLVDTSREGKYAAAARKALAGLNRDPRTGKVAILEATRYARVLVGFILKATGRDNIRFFGSEEEALAWLKTEG